MNIRSQTKPVLRALADCNNFFASCERALNPALEGIPIVVLSNNDGCVVARSAEAKLLGIPMGAPFFQVRRLCETHGVHVASSNFEVYGEFSARVMEALAEHARDLEVYSIDEAFMGFPDLSDDQALALGQRIRSDVRARTGITVSIGLAPTTVLCKLANELGKREAASEGVVVMPSDAAKRHERLRGIPVGDLWGVGKRTAALLRAHGLITVADLAEIEPARIRSFAGIVGERLALEVRGTPCHDIDETATPRKSILSSRSFGQVVTDRSDLAEALSHHAVRAAEKLREDGLVAATLVAFARTDRHREDHEQHVAEAAVRLEPPTNDGRRLSGAIAQAMDAMWVPGLRWKRAGVYLADLSSALVTQPTLPGFGPPEAPQRRRLMEVMDALNAQLGKDSVRLASTGFDRAWKPRAERLTDSKGQVPEAGEAVNDPRVKRTRIRFFE